MFLRLAGADKEMDAEELSDMLTASLAKSSESVAIYVANFMYMYFGVNFKQIEFLFVYR